MESYYEPDYRWEIYGITTKEQFEQQFVVKGFFHEGVPMDVKDAFTTVEYLQAHAYYFWPMYDEAFNKALRLLEMAIKQKAKLLKIPLNNKSFNKLINEICKESYNERLENALHRARKIRNNQVHAETNSYSGAMAGKGNNIELFVTILNELFRDDSWIISQYEQQQAIQEQIRTFENSLLILENNGLGILISGILGFRYFNESLFLVCNPVLKNTKQALEEHKYSKPFAIELSKIQFQENILSGISTDGNAIKIYKTNKAENLIQLNKHKEEISSVSQTNREIYKSYMNNEASWSLVKLEYNHLSKNLNQLCHLPNSTALNTLSSTS